MQVGTFVTGSVYVLSEPGAELLSVSHSVKPTVMCEIDPQDPSHQGIYDTTGMYATAYDPRRTVSFPLAIPSIGIHSIVAAAHLKPEDYAAAPNGRRVHEIEVLTVLQSIGEGTYFRPPYAGDPEKKEFFTFRADNLDLASLTGNRPGPALNGTLSGYVSYLGKIQYEYFAKNYVTNEGNISAGSLTTGIVNIPDGYGADRARIRSEAYICAANPLVPLEQRKPLLEVLIQLGIDTYFAIKHGKASFVEAGGHGHGRWLPIAIAAWALKHKDMYEFCWHSARHRNAPGVETFFEEFAHFYHSPVINEVLFGMPEAYGKTYWTEYGHHEGAWLFKDPLERIDGGNDPGSAYQAIITGALTHLIFAATYNPNLFALIDFKMVMYAIRYATRGAICLPDPASAQRPNVAAFDRRRDYGHVSTQLFAELLPLLGAPPLSIKQV